MMRRCALSLFPALVSLSLYNLLKFIVLWVKIKMQPLTWQVLWVLAIGALAYLAAAWLPNFGLPLIGLLLKSSVVALIFGGLVLRFRLSPDINQLVENLWQRVK